MKVCRAFLQDIASQIILNSVELLFKYKINDYFKHSVSYL